MDLFFLERFNFFCTWWFIEWMCIGSPFHFIDYSFHATKGCGRYIFGLKFVGKIHDGLLVWILQTIRPMQDEDVQGSPSLLAHPKPLSNLVPKFEMVQPKLGQKFLTTHGGFWKVSEFGNNENSNFHFFSIQILNVVCVCVYMKWHRTKWADWIISSYLDKIRKL